MARCALMSTVVVSSRVAFRRLAAGRQVISHHQDQARDRAGTDPLGVRGRITARRGADGRRLRGRYWSAHEHHDIGLALRRRYPVTHDRMGTWHRAASAKEVVGSRATNEAVAPR